MSNSCGGGDKHLPSSNPPEYDLKKVYTAPVSSSSQAAVSPVKPAEPEQPLIELPSLEPEPNEKSEWRKAPPKRVPHRGFRLNDARSRAGIADTEWELGDSYVLEFRSVIVSADRDVKPAQS